MSAKTEKNQRKAWKKDIMKIAGKDANIIFDDMINLEDANKKLKKELLFYQIGFYILLPISALCGVVIYYMIRWMG